jgi:hypothetical protein
MLPDASAVVAPSRQAPPAPPPPTAASSLTDWLCSALLGRSWQFLTGVDLLPKPEQQLMDSEDPEAPVHGAAEQGATAAEGEGERQPLLYASDGKHGMAGYHVRTVGNAPVAAPCRLTAEQAAEVAAAAGSTGGGAGGSAWNAAGGTWETKDTTAWAKNRLPQLCSANAARVITRLEVVEGDASLAVVRGCVAGTH